MTRQQPHSWCSVQFRKSHNTVGCIFILHQIQERTTSVYLFCWFFIKLCRVCQNCLWRKLGKLGLSEKMRNTLETIYKHVAGRVKGANGHLSDPNPTRNGVRQGCPLSPLLFPFSISDIPESLQEGGCTGVTLNWHISNQLSTVCWWSGQSFPTMQIQNCCFSKLLG